MKKTIIAVALLALLGAGAWLLGNSHQSESVTYEMGISRQDTGAFVFSAGKLTADVKKKFIDIIISGNSLKTDLHAWGRQAVKTGGSGLFTEINMGPMTIPTAALGLEHPHLFCSKIPKPPKDTEEYQFHAAFRGIKGLPNMPPAGWGLLCAVPPKPVDIKATEADLPRMLLYFQGGDISAHQANTWIRQGMLGYVRGNPEKFGVSAGTVDQLFPKDGFRIGGMKVEYYRYNVLTPESGPRVFADFYYMVFATRKGRRNAGIGTIYPETEQLLARRVALSTIRAFGYQTGH